MTLEKKLKFKPVDFLIPIIGFEIFFARNKEWFENYRNGGYENPEIRKEMKKSWALTAYHSMLSLSAFYTLVK